MIVSMIVARSSNGVIGADNDLVWRMPADMKFFRQTTVGHFIIMGRKTLEATMKPLPGRTSIVLTRNKDFVAEGCLVFQELEQALDLARQHRQQEVFILGGAQIYQLAMPLAQRLYITEIKEHFEGDAYFPEPDTNVWQEVWREEHQADEKNPHDYAFTHWERK